MKPKYRRATFLAIAGLFVCVGAGLGVHALSKNMIYFATPTQLVQDKNVRADTRYKLGGMVVAGSYKTDIENRRPENRFSVTDGQMAVEVEYSGVLPDLFREGQSVVAIGDYDPKTRLFRAEQVLAKHDETYMPKEVADALRKSGKWDPRFGPPPDASQWAEMIKG